MKKYLALLTVLIMLLSACVAEHKSIILATTTSTEDSGLLDFLLPYFEEDTGIKVKVVARGTGESLEIGKRGDADCLLVHAKDKELEFIEQGYGIKRYEVMYNDFVIVGPLNDPAGIKQKAYNDPLKAFEIIYHNKAKFISRGDESGTHQKEKNIWEKINLEPKWENYIVTGVGMGQVLNMASEKEAYTLADRGTYLAMKDKLNLETVCGKDPILVNQYSLILLNPKKVKFKQDGAQKFIDWMVSEKAQSLIGEFGKQKYGQSLFMPNASR